VPKYFKGDELEIKMYDSASPIMDILESFLGDFYQDVYGSVPMGELLYDNDLVPLTNAIRREVFISAFKQIFDAWQFAGTFESYITVFQKIFGEDVVVDFTVPAAGKLEIDITATGIQELGFQAKVIEDNEFVYYDMVDDVGDFIMFSSVLGFETQQELETMLFTMVPAGIFTTVSLTIS
jgi:hypothetical protein